MINFFIYNFRLIDRARRTVRGSADDIGWLQHAQGMPPVEDGTERFQEILDEIKLVWYCFYFSHILLLFFFQLGFSYFFRHGVHRLPNSMVYLLIPGKVTDCAHGKIITIIRVHTP
jgi:hypothetical protein